MLNGGYAAGILPYSLKRQEAARRLARATKWMVATIGAAKTIPAKLAPPRNTPMLQAATPNPSPNS
ncbi:hypothetical protein D3C80_2170700 [compost metagenome]